MEAKRQGTMSDAAEKHRNHDCWMEAENRQGTMSDAAEKHRSHDCWMEAEKRQGTTSVVPPATSLTRGL
jgi:hypothetical protein